MAILVTRPLPYIAHIGNPMLLYCKTDNQVLTNGAAAKFRVWLSVSGTGLPLDAAVSFTLMNQVFTFTAKAAPDQSGLQVRLRQPGDTDQQYLTRLADDFAANYEIFKNYRTEVATFGGGWFVTFTARAKGPEFNLQTFSNPTATFTTTQDNGSTYENRPGFKILCQTWRTDSDYGAAILLGEDRVAPDSEGKVTFNIAELFDGLIASTFEWPLTSRVVPQNSTVRYFNILAEVFGDNPVPQKLMRTPIKTAVCGALDTEYFEQRYRSYELYPAAIETIFITEKTVLWNRNFKTWCRHQENEKFYFLSSKAFTLKKTVHYLDGSPDVTTDIFTMPIAAEKPLCWEVNASPWFVMGGAPSALDNVKYITIWATSPGTGALPIFDPVEIWIERKFDARRREFLFRNRPGAYEFVRFTGYFGQKKRFEWIDYERAGAHKNPFAISKHGKFNVEPALEIEGNTGPLSQEKHLWIREFFESPDIYEIIRGKLYSVKLTSKDYEVFKDGVFEQGVDFSYVRAEQPSLPPIESCGSDGAEVIGSDDGTIESVVG